MSNQFIQPLHSNLYIRYIHKKHDYANIMLSNFEVENKETPSQLEPEPKNGVAYKRVINLIEYKSQFIRIKVSHILQLISLSVNPTKWSNTLKQFFGKNADELLECV